MIELKQLTKKYGTKIAVDSLSMVIHTGAVTGFLGPNGAGKSTTIKMILGLVRPTSGAVLIDGSRYVRLAEPIRKIGALSDSSAINPKYTARQHLELLAAAGGISNQRVDLLLQMTGLHQVQKREVGEFSLGMRQRLGIAGALLGDPETVILDEPFNGLDVDGIKWLRSLIKDLAKQGKAVFVSSHLMSEVEAVADRIVVLAEGRLVADLTVEELAQASLSSHVRVRSEDNGTLAVILQELGGIVQQRSLDTLSVQGLEMEEIGRAAYRNNLAILELTAVRPTLEDLFVELTAGRVEFQGKALIDGGGELE